MIAQDPKQAITEYLSQDSRVIASLFPEENGTAKAITLQFLKERGIPHHQIHAVTFEDKSGQMWLAICVIEQTTTNIWNIKASLESKLRDRYLLNEREREKFKDQAWVSLSGGGNPFWACGYVMDNGFGVERVRLISSNGNVLEDVVQDGIVLFITDQEIQRPVEVKLYNSSGVIVGQHASLNGRN